MSKSQDYHRKGQTQVHMHIGGQDGHGGEVSLFYQLLISFVNHYQTKLIRNTSLALNIFRFQLTLLRYVHISERYDRKAKPTYGFASVAISVTIREGKHFRQVQEHQSLFHRHCRRVRRLRLS